jgi:hypothetical protein
MVWHDWFEWSNAGVGVVGLAVTAGALWQATGAKRAATEAREAVWQREASAVFSDLATVAGQIVESLLIERLGEAAVRARDLAARISRDRARFEPFLGADSDKLKWIGTHFQQLALRLSSGGRWEAEADFKETVKVVSDSANELNAINGRLMKRLEEKQS